MQKSEDQINERIPFKAENNPLIHQMPTRVGVMCTISDVIAKGQIVVSAGTSNGTSVGENPGSILAQLFQFQGFPLAGGYPGGTLKKLSPRSVLRRASFDFGRFLQDQQIGQGGLTGAAGTFLINSPFRFYWALPWLKRPFDTALDTGMFGSVQLTITNGSKLAQFGAGNDRTFDYSGLFWDVYHRFENYGGSGRGPAAVLFDDDRQRNISGANSRLEINKELPPDGLYLDALTIAQTTSNALADTIVNRITAQAGTEQFYDQYADQIKDCQEDYITESATNPTSRTGLYYSRFAADGLLTNAKPAISLVIDQNNPGTDNLLIARRAYVSIPADFAQTGGGMVKTGSKKFLGRKKAA